MKFSTKLALGCVGLLAGALCAAGLALVGVSFARDLAATRATLQAQQSREKYAIEQKIYTLAADYETADYEAATPTPGGRYGNAVLAGAAQAFAEQTGSTGGTLAVWVGGQYSVYSNLPGGLPRGDQLAAVQAGSTAWRLARVGGVTYLLLARPLDIPNADATLLCAYDVSAVFATRAAQLRSWLAATLALLAVGGGAAVAFSRALTRPLTRLQAASGAIAAGQYASRTAIATDDEIGAVSRSFDAMAAAVEQKMTELDGTVRQQKDFIAAFSHEVKTPMTAMLGYADLMRAKPQDAALQKEAADYIYHETHRLEELSRHLLALMGLETDRQSAAWELVTDRALFAQVLRSLPQTDDVPPRCQAGGCLVKVDRALWVDLLRNLTLNAQRACRGIPGAGVTLRCVRQGGRAVFTVADTGCGIPAADLPRVTEAFYRVDKSRARAEGSSGIGLALCSRIAELHGTALQIESRHDAEGGGTTVTVALPLQPPPEEAEPNAERNTERNTEKSAQAATEPNTAAAPPQPADLTGGEPI